MSEYEFTPALLGQAEKALNAILLAQLAGSRVTEPQWVTLSLLVMGGGALPAGELAARAAGALKISPAEAHARVSELTAADLVAAAAGPDPRAGAAASAAGAAADPGPVTLTPAGRELYARVRGAVGAITARMWGDLPAAELATTARVLTVILERANGELATG